METHDKENRKPYQKPQVINVPLRAEEAVLGFCKNATTSGPLRANCNIAASACRTAGS
jgi:hypothetical protein